MKEQAKIVAHHLSKCPPINDVETWQRQPSVLIQHLWSGEPAPSERHASVALCWSPEGLHARFVCEQHEPLLIAQSPVTDKKTLGLWDRDVCEIFVAPDPSNPSAYYEFEAAPTGEWVDLALTMIPSGRKTEWDYISGMKTTASIVKDHVVIGITIPWSERIKKPAAGDVWRVNLFRCVGPDPDDRYLAWIPTKTAEPNFHVPEAFGSLVFAE